VDLWQRGSAIDGAKSLQTLTFIKQFAGQSGSSERTALLVELIGSRNVELLPLCRLTSGAWGDEGVVNRMWLSFFAA